MKKYLTYDDVALVPQYSTIKSRSQCDTKAWLGNCQFKLPVMPSNMKCVIDEQLAFRLSEEKYFYVMHRFSSTYDFVFAANTAKIRTISISVGVKQQDYYLIDSLAVDELRVDYITIDIAHGHCAAMVDMIKYIKDRLPTTFIIAGNIATFQAYKDLAEAGADAVKVGIGQGAACTTKLKTGFTAPMFTCMQEVRKAHNDMVGNATVKAPIIIADGGIKHHGDIAKALVAGAHWVMAGGIFAQCSDSPAPTDSTTGEKVYYGSASAINKGEYKHVEGKAVNMSCSKLTYLETLNEITEDLKSAISYSGTTDALSLYGIDYIRV